MKRYSLVATATVVVAVAAVTSLTMLAPKTSVGKSAEAGRGVRHAENGRPAKYVSYTAPPGAIVQTVPTGIPIAQAGPQLAFPMRLPKDTLGQVARQAVVLGKPGAARIVELSYGLQVGALRVVEHSTDSTTEAEQDMQDALPFGQFDSRYMYRIQVAGRDAIAWDQVDMGRSPGSRVVPNPGLVFRDGNVWYLVDSYRVFDRKQLAQVAASLLP